MNIAVYIVPILIYLLKLSDASNRFECDQKGEFFCSKDKKCISMSRVCNFENDCSDGEDELRCGSCNFQVKPENCGLTFMPDRVFTWFRQHSRSNEDDEVSSYRPKKIPFNYMYVDVAQNHKQYLERGHSSQNIVYRPKVLFPHLKPTNNEKCSFAFDIFVTEKPAKLSNSKRKSSWPNIKVLLIQPRDREEEYFIKGSGAKEYKFYDLNLEKTIEDYNKLTWIRKEVLLKARSTVWTLELVVELKIKSFLIHLGNFKFLNCHNIAEKINEENMKPTNENDLLDLNNDCDNKNQFQCALSGICIDKSLLCDYGYDCGDDDTSDEEFCDDYPGRCDFEEETKCDWTSSPSFNSWIWMSAQEDDQAGYEKEAHLISRPHLDHTYMSDIIGGHYILLNTQKLSESSMYRFIGPNVALRDGAEECSFRFWVYTPTSLDNITFESAYLMAGYKRILSNELFNHKSNWKSPIKNDAFNYRSLSQNWKRYEIQMLDKYKKVEGSLFAQVTFGKLNKNDLETFSDNKGFIALDDFSFTPGCYLTFEGEVVDNMCGDNEFFCKIPTLVTNVFCIPIGYYCDFKNDCGSFKSNGEATIDEQDCPRECLFHKGEHCGYEIVDGDDLKDVGEINEKNDINEAFTYARVYDPTSKQGYLLISAHGDKFLSHFGKGMVNLRNFRIELPTFSVSHANCLFELTYLWTPDTRNTFAIVSIESEQLTWQTVLKRLNPTRYSMMKKTTVTLGIGHRSQPFKVVIELLFEGNLTEYTNEKAKQRIGSLYLYEYKFINCNFAHGLISSKTYIQFEEPVDDYGLVDYPLSVPSVNNSCKPGFFQCLEPSVCIEDKYVCDMQIDCQTSELDEMSCGNDLRFTFEECDINELPQGWLSSSLDRVKGWSVAVADRHNSPELSPPFDHTLSVEEGKFLTVKGELNSGDNNNKLIINLGRSQHQLNHESSACRMIFYLYFKISSQESHFGIFTSKESSDSDRKLIFQVKIGSEDEEIASISDRQVEAWHRVELSNLFDKQEEGTTNSRGSDQISIVFEASLSEHEFIALDDVSLSSACELEGENTRKKKKNDGENIEFGENLSQDKNNPVKENNNNNENDLRLLEDKPSSSELFLLVLLAILMVGSLVILVLVLVFVKPLINRGSLRKLNWRRFVLTLSRSRNASESVGEVGGDGTYFTLNNLESGN